jgi:hypothetical protein
MSATLTAKATHTMRERTIGHPRPTAPLRVAPDVSPETPTKPGPSKVLLTKAEATTLTRQIREQATRAGAALAKLYALVDDAKQGQAWKVLGFKSWPAYLADTMGSDGPLPLVRDDLTKLVRKLAGEGMSARGIEAATGGAVSKATANRIAKRAGIDAPTVGMDGAVKAARRTTTPAATESKSGKATATATVPAPKMPQPKADPKNPAVLAVREAIAAKGKGKSPQDRTRLAIAEYDAAISALMAARATVVKAGRKS